MNRYFEGKLLAVESSCDETSIAILDGSSILSNVISSQVDLHAQWGGVVPEAAARAHVESFLPVLELSLKDAGISLEAIDAIAVTDRPGLVGSLSVGLAGAVGLALAQGLPMIGVHHLEGHLWSVLASEPSLETPFLSLLVSGGHTEIILVKGIGDYEVVGSTIDDAAGEAFDKAARLLGLGYPGGQAVEKTAAGGNPNRYPLPRALMDRPAELSFSGLKTAVMRLVEKEGELLNVQDAAACVQWAIVEVLADKVMALAVDRDIKTITIVGGVAANRSLRHEFQRRCDRDDIMLLMPPLSMCTDNAAMIGLAGSLRLARGERSGLGLDVISSAPLPYGT